MLRGPARARVSAKFGKIRSFRDTTALIAVLAAAIASPAAADTLLLRPAQVFDGVDPRPHAGCPAPR